MRSRGGSVGAVLLLLMALVGWLAPLLANDRPLLLRTDSGLSFPAAGELALVGALFERPGWRNLEWRRPRPGEISRVAPPIPYSYRQIDLQRRLSSPSRRHWLGTDSLGRDLAARIVHGASVSLSVGAISTGIALAIGILLGGLAGAFGGATDFLVTRLTEIVLAFPTFFLVLAVLAFRPPSLPLLFGVIALTRWPSLARYTRGEVLRLKAQGFVEAARSSGTGRARLLLRHVLPHALTPVLVAATFQFAGAMLMESGLSFLGFGVQEPLPSWGGLLSDARQSGGWWLVLYPGVALTLAVTSTQLLGDALRDRLDPRLARL